MVRARQHLVMAIGAAFALGACDRGDGPPASGGPASSASSSAGAGTAANAPKRAVIKMDTAHDAMSVKDAPPYAIAPSAELEIEVGEYRFRTRDGGPGAPDAVHVVHGSSGYHRASFSGRQVVLNVASLDAVKGGAFQGFEAGESYYVAVGAEAAAPDGAMRFTPFWSARVNVAAH
jgi:hypothetical protein